jgi:hypothetical protein
MFFGALAIGLAAGSQVMAGGSGPIPLPYGNFSLTSRGTELSSGTLHFVVSDGGNRIDNVVTFLEVAGASGYSITFTERQQQSPGSVQNAQ